MELWRTRLEANRTLDGPLRRERDQLQLIFDLLDECAQSLGGLDTEFGRVSCLCTIKAINLLQGCYSLTQDGLAQESGALLRPLIEVMHVMVYVREPKNLSAAVEGRLPQSGKIARSVENHFQGLRKYLSDNASHFGLTWESVRHVVDIKSGSYKTSQPHNAFVLRENMHTLLGVAMLLLVDVIVSVAQAGLDVRRVAEKAEAVREQVLSVVAEAGFVPSVRQDAP